ncbi:MAG: PHP domain-containing protein [Patescibacteria group bacterium]|jgi:hypothetical protein
MTYQPKHAAEKIYKEGVKRIFEHVHIGKADLHIHSNFSDAKPSIEEILEWTQKKTDLDIIAITDHDTIDGALLAQKIAKTKKYRFEIVVGEEISTKEGHVLGLFLTEKIKPHLTAHETLKQIKSQGGVSIAAHPFNYTRLNGGKMTLNDGIGMITLFKEKDLVDAVETVNATPTRNRENLSAQFMNDTVLFRAETGGSDAHILDAIGMGQTLFEGRHATELKDALLHNQTKAISKRWRLMALLRYLYFFLPKGLRLFFYTLFHGRRAKRPEMFISQGV